MTGEANVISGLLSKKGIPDVRLELRCISPSDFEVIENGRPVSVFHMTGTPPNRRKPAVSEFTTPPPLGLREAWEKCVAQRYRGYKVSNLKEEARAA